MIRNIIALMLICGGTSIHADLASPPPEVVACAKTVGVDGKTPDQFTDEEHEQMHACMRQKGMLGHPHHPRDFAKFKACVEAQGVTLPPHRRGQPPPDDKTKAILDSCRDSQEAPPAAK